MARLDVFANPEGEGYLLDVQADLLDLLNARVVVPLLPRAQAPQPAKRLNPVFTIDADDVVMVTQFLAAVPTSLLRQRVGTLAEAHDEVTVALDMLFQGF